MSNRNCGPDIVKYFVVEPSSGTITGSTGDFYVCQGTTFLKTISGCTDSVNINDNIFYNDGDVYFNGVVTACTGIHTSAIRGCSPITIYDLAIFQNGIDVLTGDTILQATSATTFSLTNLPNVNNTATQILVRNTSSGLVEYRDVSTITPDTNTFVTGTTFNNNQAVLTRNDGFDVFKLTGGTFVTLSNPSTNQIKIDLSIPPDTNTFVTGFTYDNINTFTVSQNDGSTFDATISVLSGITYYGDGSNLTGISTEDKFVSGGTYNTGTQEINFVGNSPETTFDVDLSSIISTDTYVTGFTFNPTTYDLTIKQNEGQPDLVSNLAVLASDVYVVSGVYDPATGIVTYTNSSGGTFQVSGFTTGMTDSYTTDAYLNGTEIRFDNNIQGANFYNVDLLPLLSGKTDNTTFNTYTANTQTILDSKIDSANNVGSANEFFKDKSGTTLNFRTLSGGSNTTISTIGDVVKVDVTIPADTNTFVTGGTYSNVTDTITLTRNDGGIIDITGVTNTFVTGTTFTSNEATLTRNDGFNVLSLSGTNDVTLTNPSTNQIVIDVNGLKYFISETSPTGFTLSNGYRWFNTSIGSEFVYIDDGDSSQWVQPLIQPGPEGPIGPQGPVGPQGPSGFTGTFITTGITTSAATLTTNYTYYGVNYIGDVDLTLPDPTGIDGVNIMIKDEGGNASFNRIRLITSVGLIDGNSSIDMVNNYQSTYIVARNNNWWII